MKRKHLQIPEPFASPQEVIGSVAIEMEPIHELLLQKPELADIVIKRIRELRPDLEQANSDLHAAMRFADKIEDDFQRALAWSYITNALDPFNPCRLAVEAFQKIRDNKPQTIECYLILGSTFADGVLRDLSDIPDIIPSINISHRLFPLLSPDKQVHLLERMRWLAQELPDGLKSADTWTKIYELSQEAEDRDKAAAAWESHLGTDLSPMIKIFLIRASSKEEGWREVAELMAEHSYLQTRDILLETVLSARKFLDQGRAFTKPWLTAWLKTAAGFFTDHAEYQAIVHLALVRYSEFADRERLLSRAISHIDKISDPTAQALRQLDLVQLLADSGRMSGARGMTRKIDQSKSLILVRAFSAIVKAKRLMDEEYGE